MLQAAIHTNADVRRNAIQKAILKKLYRIEELKAGIEGFARCALDRCVLCAGMPSGLAWW